MKLSGARALVTGATGFIGGRLVERLVAEEGATVRALVRDFSTASRIARYPIAMVAGNVLDADAVDRAVDGCDVVFHCAYGNGGEDAARQRVNVEGTELVLAAALRHRCRRVVHVSTYSVYGDPAQGDVDERTPRRRTGSTYGDSKLDAETRALAYCAKGLSVAVVQPTIVYGPFGLTWTARPLEQMRTGRVILIDGGAGIANPVYIDDVVSALVAAAESERAHGETFLISGDRPISWREFFLQYEAIVGRPATVSMTAAEARAHFARSQPRLLADSARVLRQEIRKREAPLRERLERSPLGRVALDVADRMALLHEGERPGASEAFIHPMFPAKIPTFTSKARVRIDKAAVLLGYRPAYDVDRGMALTAGWARWANII